MRWATLMLATVLMLAWTATATAESAWVLWQEVRGEPIPSQDNHGKQRKTWYQVEAFGQRSQCEAQRKRSLDAIARMYAEQEHFHKVKREAGGVSYEVIAEETRWAIQEQLHCLPDTLDPRQKKE